MTAPTYSGLLFRILSITLMFVVGLPIVTPSATTYAQSCTDEDKIEWLNTYIEALKLDDPQAMLERYTEDALLTLDNIPEWDEDAGEFVVTGVGEYRGWSELEPVKIGTVDFDVDWILQNVTVNDGVLEAHLAVITPNYARAMGLPLTSNAMFMRTEFENCLAKQIIMFYPDESLQTLNGTHQAFAASGCSEEDITALVRGLEVGYNTDNAEGVAQLFTEDAHYIFDGPPQYNEATGTYASNPEFKRVNFGTQEIFAQAEGLINAEVDWYNESESIEVNGNTVTFITHAFTPAYAADPWNLPKSHLTGLHTATVENCKISSLFFSYMEETLTELNDLGPAPLEVVCTDEEKIDLLVTFVDAQNRGQAAAAAHQFANDGVLNYTGPPRLDAATGTYYLDPEIERYFEGHAAMIPPLEQLHAIGLFLDLDPDSFAVESNTVHALATATTSVFIEPFKLPLTTLGGAYEVTVDENCQIAKSYFYYLDETLDVLAKAQQILSRVEDANKTVVARFADAVFNQSDMEIVDEMVAPDAVLHHPLNGDMVGIEGIKQWGVSTHELFPDFQLNFDVFNVEHNMVLKEWTATGTQASSDKEISIGPAISTYRLENGKIVEITLLYNTYDFMQQIGAVLNPQQAAANEAIVAQLAEEVFNKGNLDIIPEIVSPGVVLHHPLSGEITGIAGVTEWGASAEELFADFVLVFETHSISADRVLKEWTATGVHKETGNPIVFDRSMSIYRLEDGKIVEITQLYNTLELMRQLGVIPSAGE